MRAARLLMVLAALAITCAACARAAPADSPPAEPPFRLAFVADFALPFEGRETGLEFGGLSGLAFDPETGVWVGVSDDRRSPRWFTLRVGFAQTGLKVEVGPAVLAENVEQNPAVPTMLDFESVGILPGGDLLIGSEGDLLGGVRHRHSLVRFTRAGRFVGETRLPDRYLGDPEGLPPRGLRGNLGFEGMALAPDGARVWLVAENPLAQDDGKPTMDRGARTRLLELVAANGSFVPARELVYEIDASGRPPVLGPDAVLADQGVVALLWLGADELLSMERAFLRDATSGVNVVRIYHVRLDGADDVSDAASLRDRPAARPVAKTLVLDLDDVVGALRPSLARLDNFEAMAWGPPLPDGTRTILIASDDNFSARQQNAFVVLGLK